MCQGTIFVLWTKLLKRVLSHLQESTFRQDAIYKYAKTTNIDKMIQKCTIKQEKVVQN